MIKAILFDYGGVITRGGARDDLSVRLSNNLGITVDEAVLLVRPSWHEFSEGKISEAEFWQNVETEYGKPIADAERNIWNTWGEHMKPDPEMVTLVAKLKKDGYAVGLLSNVIHRTADDIREHGGYDMFDFAILSCEVGYAKPDKEIYQLALDKMPNVQPDEVIFVDDQERCLVPARELGLQTVLAQNPTQISEDVTSVIIDQNGLL